VDGLAQPSRHRRKALPQLDAHLVACARTGEIAHRPLNARIGSPSASHGAAIREPAGSAISEAFRVPLIHGVPLASKTHLNSSRGGLSLSSSRHRAPRIRLYFQHTQFLVALTDQIS
jgi:hypothetical protein